mgnify:CR=1 FL=1
MSTIRILGSGAWGTSLALLWSQEPGDGRATPQIELIARTDAEAELLRRTRVNERRLPGVTIPAGIDVRGSSASMAPLGRGDLFVVSLPTTALDPAVTADIVDRAGAAPIGIASKGLTVEGMRPSQLLIEAGADPARIAVLSGPNLAHEIARGKPAAAVLAGAPDQVESLRAAVARPSFRVYATDDLPGVELSGAIKNVIAIAVSGVRALGYGENAAAALLSRGVAEMARLVEACGGRTETACGLAGVGDLVVTSSNTGSRNARLGALLASGLKVTEAVEQIGATIEGIGTAHGALRLAAAHRLELPITAAVVAALDGGTTIDTLARALLGRSPAGEWRRAT